MSKLSSYFKDYASYHQTRGNQRTHLIGIPMIMIAVLSWAARWVWVPGAYLQMDFAVLIILAATAWYCSLEWGLGLSFLPVVYGFYWIGRALPNSWAWAFFILGWLLQGLGHAVFEKKTAAFTKNIEHLLIGPLWIFVKTLHLDTRSNN